MDFGSVVQLVQDASDAAFNYYLTPAELCAWYKATITEKTLANWRSRGEGPSYIKLGGKVVYRLADVLSWEAKRRIGS
jgi:hypothetical protein